MFHCSVATEIVYLSISCNHVIVDLQLKCPYTIVIIIILWGFLFWHFQQIFYSPFWNVHNYCISSKTLVVHITAELVSCTSSTYSYIRMGVPLPHHVDSSIILIIIRSKVWQRPHFRTGINPIRTFTALLFFYYLYFSLLLLKCHTHISVS